MSNIDTRVVEAKFDNKQFQDGTAETLKSLDKLKQGLKLDGATKGLEDIDAASKKVSLSKIADGVDSIAHKFGLLGIAATAAFATIISKATMAGVHMAKSFTMQPITDGLREYETQLGAIQTILANTQWQNTNLKDVNKALDELNAYSDKTIYNFTEMARNIGTFTAAGVKLDTSVNAIKGIANLAAISGSTSEQASTAMYQLSQALASGTVKLMDWNSVVNAGMGGKVFQDALKETARNHHVNIDQMIKDEGSFRESLKNGWLTSGILTETLSKFTGDMTDAQLKKLGYTEKQIIEIQKQAKMANEAATKVKTFTQLMGTLKEAAGSGWAQSWRLIIGDFEEAKGLWTSVSDTLGGAINESAIARNKMLKDWNDLGGRAALIDSVSNAFKALMDILVPIQDAWREFFPAMTGKRLYDLTEKLFEFTAALRPSKETIDRIARIFSGFFAILSIGKKIVGGIVTVISNLFHSVSGGAGGFLEVVAKISDFIVEINAMLEKSNAIENFFLNISDYLYIPLKALNDLGVKLGEIFSKFDYNSAHRIPDVFHAIGDALDSLGTGIDRVMNFLGKIGGLMKKLGDPIITGITKIGTAIANVFTPEVFSQTLHVINTGLLAAITLMLKRFFDKGINFNPDGGLVSSIKETLGAVTNYLGAMQAQVKANVIMKIAIALGILTASVAILAMIDPKRLALAIGAMGAGFAALQISMTSLSGAFAGMGALKLPLISAGLVGLATSILILAAALKVMASMELGDLLRGLFGVTVVLKILQKAMSGLAANAGGMIRSSAALILVGVALNLIAAAMKIFATMDWVEMGKGLIGVVGSLTAIAIGMQAMPGNILLQAAALTILGVALAEFAGVMKIFATMKWEEIGKGLVGIAGSLIAVAGAMYLMPPHMLLQAAALVAVGVALNAIGAAMRIMGGMSWGEIGKGLVALGGSLVVLAAGLYLMTGAIGGAIALTIAAAALNLFVPVLVILGNLDWMTIIKGLTAIAGIFLVLGLAGLALTPLVPTILALSAALLLIGAGLLLAGAGAFLLATALSILLASASALVGTLAQILVTLIASIPMAMQAVADGIVVFAVTLAEGAPRFYAAMVKLLNTLLDAAIATIPKVGRVFLTMINTALTVLNTSVPKIAASALNIVLAVLKSLNSRMREITATAVSIVANFIRGIGDNIKKVIDAGVQLVLDLINGIADAIDEHSEELGEAGGRLAVAIIEGMIKGIKGGAKAVAKAVTGVAGGALDAAKDFLGINSPSREFAEVGMGVDEGFALGVDKYGHLVRSSVEEMGSKALNTMKDTMKNLSDITVIDGDLQPTITPVVDLTNVKKGFAEINGMVKVPTITLDSTYSKATNASAEYNRNLAAGETPRDQTDAVGPHLSFTQNNYSPKALSETTIYRQTKNQLSVVKGALATNADSS